MESLIDRWSYASNAAAEPWNDADGAERVAEALTDIQIMDKLLAIIERAEYAGRMGGFAVKTTSERQAKLCREASEVSSRHAIVMAHELVAAIRAAR